MMRHVGFARARVLCPASASVFQRRWCSPNLSAPEAGASSTATPGQENPSGSQGQEAFRIHPKKVEASEAITESAEDGAEALNKAKAGNYDVVITDVHMPVMDGITFTRELRKLNHCRFIPVLVLTTESASEMKMQGKNAGATGWIVKPFNPDSLNRVLDRVLDPGRS